MSVLKTSEDDKSNWSILGEQAQGDVWEAHDNHEGTRKAGFPLLNFACI